MVSEFSHEGNDSGTVKDSLGRISKREIDTFSPDKAENMKMSFEWKGKEPKDDPWTLSGHASPVTDRVILSLFFESRSCN